MRAAIQAASGEAPLASQGADNGAVGDDDRAAHDPGRRVGAHLRRRRPTKHALTGPSFPLRGRRTGVKMAGGTARDVV